MIFGLLEDIIELAALALFLAAIFAISLAFTGVMP